MTGDYAASTLTGQSAARNVSRTEGQAPAACSAENGADQPQVRNLKSTEHLKVRAGPGASGLPIGHRIAEGPGDQTIGETSLGVQVELAAEQAQTGNGG